MPPTLQDGIDEAGSPVELLWKPGAKAWVPEVIEPEYNGWRQEQAGWHSGVAISDLSHHMADLFISGPDSTRLLSEVSANNYALFEIGQAKQLICVTEEGKLVMDGILMRTGEQSYTLSGVPTSQNWVAYHGETGGYDVEFVSDPSSAFRGGGDPALFRYQVQGPLASELVESASDGPLPPTKFFHSIPVSLGGRSIRALRHNMAGQDGYEFIGQWDDGDAIKDTLLRAGEPLGVVRVGALAYPTSSVESGWIPAPTPGIYTSASTRPYREHASLYSFEGQHPLHGSFFSEDIEDYYCSPFEIGYGRSVFFNHDFIGRDALAAAKDDVRRTKVTLVLDPTDIRNVLGEDPGFVLSLSRHRVQSGSKLVGTTQMTASIDPIGEILALALIDRAQSEPGTEVAVVWGEHPGPGTDPDADLGFPTIRARVQPAPYDRHARTEYRRD